MTMYINIQGLPIELSTETVNAFKAHAEFCSAGAEWLVKNDPKLNFEYPLIEAVNNSIRRDCDAALENLTRLVHAACLGEIDLSNLDKEDYWQQLEELLF